MLALYQFDPDAAEIGKNIRRERKRKGWTQDDLAWEMETDRANISKYENGQRDMSLSTFYRFCEVLGVSPNTLSPDKRVKVSSRLDLLIAEAEELDDADIEFLLMSISNTKRLKAAR